LTITFGQSHASLLATRRLAQSSDSLSRVFEQLSTGMRINRASDDAAGLAVSSALNVESRIFAQGMRNLSDGTSMLNIADQALNQLSNIVQRQIELAEQAANGVLSPTQLAPLNDEAQELREEYLRILETASFNNQKIFDPQKSHIALQAGIGDDAVLNIEILEKEAASLQTFSQEVSMAQPLSFYSSTFSSVRFLSFEGDDGKDTLIALTIGTNSLGLIALKMQSYRVGDSGEFEAVAGGQHIIQSGISAGDFGASASFGASTVGNRVVFDFHTQSFVNLSSEFGRFWVNSDGTFGAVEGVFGPSPDQTTTILTGDFTGLSGSESVTSGGAGSISFNATLSTMVEGGNILHQNDFLLLSQESSLLALDALKSQLEVISNARSRIGASQSRVEVARNVLDVSREQSLAAASRITDVDMAGATAELVRLSILQQAGAAVLAQANIQPEIALGLLQQASS